MNKEEILEKLNNLDLDKDKYLILSEASLVLQGLLDSTPNIDLSCEDEYYKEINLDTKLGAFGIEVKYLDNIEISYNLYYPKDFTIVDGYKCINLERCLDIKKRLNRKKDKKLIEKLDLYLCSKDPYRYERKLKETGVNLIGGVDEVGRGPLVGPVVAACVILPDDFNLEGLTDSKKLSEKKRDYYYEEIKRQALSIGIGIIDEKKIDQVNIYEATKLAMRQAINNCSVVPEHILIDAMPLDIDIPTTSIIKGDLKSITISAASVIAKVTRDRMLYDLDKKYPMYDFKNNKGYPTKKHLDAIDKYGILNEHRKSYSPVDNYIKYNKTRVYEEIDIK